MNNKTSLAGMLCFRVWNLPTPVTKHTLHTIYTTCLLYIYTHSSTALFGKVILIKLIQH